MATGIPTNRTNIELPAEVSSEILQKTQQGSVVMQLARQIALPGRGAQIPVITGDPTADWVTETGSKPVSNPSLSKKIMQGHKLAVIVPFSNEFRRDASALYNALIDRLPAALGKEFDKTVFFGPASSLANFDDFSAVTTQALDATSKNAYDGIVAAEVDINGQGGVVNGYVFSPQGRGILLATKDGDGRPLFNSIVDGNIPTILGALLGYSVGTMMPPTRQARRLPAQPPTAPMWSDSLAIGRMLFMASWKASASISQSRQRFPSRKVPTSCRLTCGSVTCSQFAPRSKSVSLRKRTTSMR